MIMKRFHLYLAASVFIYFSCKKNDIPDEIKIKKNEIQDFDLSTSKENSGSVNKENDLSLKVITSKEIRKHIGDSLKVKGFVADIYLSEKVAYLNFENKFPKNDLACTVFSGRFDEFGDLSVFKGKNVMVTGKVTTFKGKPQIILNSKDQIKIIQ
jgi:hypothetical protein